METGRKNMKEMEKYISLGKLKEAIPDESKGTG